MVCISVVCTVFVIHVSYKKTKMPRWIEALVINGLGRLVCITGAQVNTNREKKDHSYVNQSMMVETSIRGEGNGDAFHSSGNLFANGNLTVSANGQISSAFGENTHASLNDYSQIAQTLHSMKNEMNAKLEEDYLLSRWRLVSVIIDRLLLLTFTMFAFVVTVVMTTYVIFKSDMDFETVTNEDYE